MQSDLANRFARLREKVLVKRPVLDSILKKRGDRKLIEYSKDYVDVNLPPTIPRRQNEFLGVVAEVVESRFDKKLADSVVNQLKKYYFVSTADHDGPITHPFFLNSNLLTAVAMANHSDPAIQNVIVLACANISVDNSSFPRGLFFHNVRDGKLQTHRMSFFSANTRPPAVYTLPPYTKVEVEKILKELKTKLDKDEIGEMEYEKMSQLMKEVYDQPDVYNSSTYMEQISKTNYKLWPRLFETSKVKLPNLVYLELEDIVVRLLIKHHLYQDTILNHILFDPTYEPYINQYFEGIFGSFSRADESGTYLFWALPKGSKRNLQLWRKGNFLVSKDESYKIELKPEVIQKAMEEKELIPGLLLAFSTVSFYYGVKCLGGFNQVNYLTHMKNGYIKMNVDIGNYRSIEVCARAQTKEICDGLSFAFMEYGEHEVALASGPDLILYGKQDSWERLVNSAKEISFEEALTPLMPEMYKISYDKTEWEPDLESVTEKDLNEMIGLHDKAEPCIEIPKE